MKKLLCFLAVPFLLTGCLDELKTSEASQVSTANTIKYQKEIDIARDNGPQDIVCSSGGVVTYKHENVILYRSIYSDTRNIDVYEQDTTEKVVVSGDCTIRPHK
jgi:PBP1b-binding outer membrane lipoprotein LpoB